MARLQDGKSKRHFRFPLGKEIYIFLKESSLSVDTRQSPIQWLVKSYNFPTFRKSGTILPHTRTLLLCDDRSVSSFTSREKTSITHSKGIQLGPVVNLDGGEENLCPFPKSNIHLIVVHHVLLTPYELNYSDFSNFIARKKLTLK